MVQDTQGNMSLLSRRGEIPGPTPVVVPQRKNHVAELLSRLTLSTASSRAKADAKADAKSEGKRNPAINGGHYFGQGIAPSLGVKGSKLGARPVIGRPTPIQTPTMVNRPLQSPGSVVVVVPPKQKVLTEAETEPQQSVPGTTTPERKPRAKSMATAITTNATRVTSAQSPVRNGQSPGQPTTPRITPSKPRAVSRQGGGRQSPYKPRKVVASTSALGRSSALRNQGRNQGFSRVQELKLKVVELERVMNQAQSDKELIQFQAARIRELEEQLQYSDDQSIVSVVSSTGPMSPKVRQTSQLFSIEKWEQHEQTLKKREERIRIREDRVARAETQAKLAQADAKAAVAEKEAIQQSLESIEAQRKNDRAKLEDLHEELDSVKTSRDNLQRQVTAFQVLQRTLEKQLKIAQRDAHKAKRAMASLETNVNDLLVTIEEKNMENDELNRSITRVMQQAASVLRPTSQSDSTDGFDSPLL